MHISRQSYDLLAWLGDIGGLLQALEWIGMFFMASFNLNNSNFVRIKNLFIIHKQNYKQNAKSHLIASLSSSDFNQTTLNDLATETLYYRIANEYMNRV